MINRVLYKQITEVLGQYPVVALTGPRQSGKTTVLKEELKGYRYVSLENPDNRDFALKDPNGFLKTYSDHVIFDEVQNTPQLFSYIQTLVDERREMGQFVLSGSQNFQLIERITQSLAGRVAMLRLLPFQLSEMNDANWLAKTLPDILTNGFYPSPFERQINPDRFYSNYLNTYVNRDVSQLINLKDSRSFKAFVKLCALRAGQILNLSDLARDAGVSHATVKNWLSILETSFIIYLLPPYYENFGKRLIKAPKLYFYDVGLLAHLLGIRKGNLSPSHSHWGFLFENMVITELMKIKEHNDLSREYYYWRDSNGHEVDLLYKEDEQINVFEIKASSTIRSQMLYGLDYVDKISSGRIGIKTLIYGGKQSQKRSEYEVVAWCDLK